jgi:hypothetical protein
MASIAFTDGTGAATLTNGKPVPADRFRNWTPDTDTTGPKEEGSGTGDLFVWSFRDNYLVTFDLECIPASSITTLMRLKRWLIGGGAITVNTGDAASRSYTCKMPKGQPPQITYDPEFKEYTLKLTLRNTAAADLVCEYS